MAGIEKTTGQPMAITLKGKEYKLHPITLADIASFKQHVKDQKLEMLNEVKNEKIQLKLIEKLMDTEISDKELDDHLQTLEGIAFLLWKMMRGAKSLDEVGRLIEVNEVEKLSVIAMGINGKPEKK